MGFFKRTDREPTPDDSPDTDAAEKPEVSGDKRTFSLGDQIRLAVSWRTDANPAALASREIPARMVSSPAIAQFVSKGKYANELMRIDNFVNNLIDEEQRGIEEDGTIPGTPVTRPKHRWKWSHTRVPTAEFARNIGLLQEVVQSAHIAVEDLRHILEEESPDEKVHLRISYRLGDLLWDDDIPNGITARFSLIYSDGALFESFLYINYGGISVTQLTYIGDDFDIRTIDERPWPHSGEVRATRFVTLDESWTRHAGFRLLSKSGDTVDENFWLESEVLDDFNERLAPEKKSGTDDPVMDSVTWKSMFVANYAGLEMIVGAFIFLFISSVAWRSGAWWTILPLALAAACFGLMLYLLFKIIDSRLGVDRMAEKQKPDREVWWLTQITRATITIVATVIMACAAAVMDIRVRGDEADVLTYESFFSLYPICAVIGILVWIALGRRIRLPMRLNPIDSDMDRQRSLSDAIQSAILLATAATMLLLADDGAYDTSSLLIFILVVVVLFPLVAYGVSRLWSVVGPLRSIGQITAPLYVHGDSGLTRQQWSDKYGMNV